MNTLFLVTIITLVFSAIAQDTSRERKMTFTNLCKEPIWVGSWAMLPNGSQSHPLNGGWAMNAGESTIIMVSGLLTSARFWPRTGCKTQNGGTPSLSNPLRCDTGDCWNPTNNGLQCAGITGQPPATLFEITLTGLGAAKDDTYDVSVVDGYNVGIAVQSIGGEPLGGQWDIGDKYNCGGTQCTFDMAKNCPPELKVEGSDGSLEGCASICTAVKGTEDNPFLDVIRNGVDNKTGYPLTNLVCCDCAAGPGVGCSSPKCEYGCSPHDISNPGGKCFVEDWPVSSIGIPYQDLYQNDCPDSYAWQFADLTSTFHCINADYNIQFCPENAQTTSSVGASPGKPETTLQSPTKSVDISIVDSTPATNPVPPASNISQEDTVISVVDETQQAESQIATNNRVGAPLKVGAIIGIAVGGIAFVVIVAIVLSIGFVLRRRRIIRSIAETSEQLS